MDRLKVFMLNPPFLKRYSRPQRNPGVTRSDTMYYPYWMAYATGALEKAGFDVQPTPPVLLRKLDLTFSSTMPPRPVMITLKLRKKRWNSNRIF